ncbi:MAG: CCDC90 family protein [Magnetococcus sp. THC-1_WYH]
MLSCSVTIVFDTLAYAKRLRSAGVPEAQAEVHAEAMSELIEERLATKRDLHELEANLKRDMREMELRLTHNLTLRLGAMTAASVAIMAALVKLL